MSCASVARGPLVSFWWQKETPVTSQTSPQVALASAQQPPLPSGQEPLE